MLLAPVSVTVAPSTGLPSVSLTVTVTTLGALTATVEGTGVMLESVLLISLTARLRVADSG
jgi:hypothetical protein